MKKKIVMIFGTRPELIKLFPVIRQLELRGLRDQLILINTGQHLELMAEDLQHFNIRPDHTLHALQKGQSLQSLTATLLKKLELLLLQLKKENTISAILAQGDTNTTFAAALSAFYNQIPFLHIESGLRTQDIHNPYPEELNRKTADLIAAFHYVPTLAAKENLLKEGIAESSIMLTGNTVVDALMLVQPMAAAIKSEIPELFLTQKNIVLITCHRRESRDRQVQLLHDHVMQLAQQQPNYFFLWLSHPGVQQQLSQPPLSNFKVMLPLSYSEMRDLYAHVKIIITDSGGIQEEAASLQIPTLVVRSKTERQELVAAGLGRITDFSSAAISKNFEELLSQKSIPTASIYGNGKASEMIVEHIAANYLL